MHVPDSILAAAKENMEYAAKCGRDFLPVAIFMKDPKGEARTILPIPFRDEVEKCKMHLAVGLTARKVGCAAVSLVQDVYMRKATSKEALAHKESGEAQIVDGGLPSRHPMRQEALMVLHLDFNDESKCGALSWGYVRAAGQILWDKEPVILPGIEWSANIPSWVMEGYGQKRPGKAASNAR